MCGIVAAVSRRGTAPGSESGGAPGVGAVAVASLARLQYRGYDSFGFAIAGDGELNCYRSLEALDDFVEEMPAGIAAIGHTRWATHGPVSIENCHPHNARDGSFALVHNGIVENHQLLRRSLLDDGAVFDSGTDTEVIAREFERLLAAHPGDARDVVCRQLRTNLAGRNTVAILFRDGEVIAFRDGSPLVLGLAANLVFVASDVHSFTPWATRCLVPADGEMVQIDGETLTRYDASGEVMALSWLDLPPDSGNADKAGYRHYMIKEVMESWQVVAHQMQVAGSMDVLAARACASRTTWVVGAGGAYYTSVQIAWLLREAGVAAVAVQAYEIDAMCFGLQPDDVVLAVSQSGETADTIDAVLAAKKTGAFIAALINARFSTLAQLADVVFENGSGPEICVLSTKSAVAQITFGYLLASACSGRDCDTSSAIDELSYGLSRYLTEATLRSVDQVARKIEHAEHVFVLGRQRHVGTALIAALNIKEAACIHAEAFAAGELKHGVIALIERGTPVIVFRDAGDDAMLNAAAQVAARGAVVIGAADAANTLYDAWLPLPALPRGQVAPLAAAIVPCQMLSYQLAVRRRLNPDKPRNLAKSVTVR